MTSGCSSLSVYYILKLFDFTDPLLILVIVPFYVCIGYSMLKQVWEYAFCKVSKISMSYIVLSVFLVGLVMIYVADQPDHEDIISIAGLLTVSVIAIFTTLSYRNSILERIWTLIAIGLIILMIGIAINEIYDKSIDDSIENLAGPIVMLIGSSFFTLGMIKFRKVYNAQ